MKTTKELLEILEIVAENESICMGNCDLDPPYKECSVCRARGALNHAYEVLLFAYEDIEENSKREKKKYYQ
jgi:hypothetical protein